MLPGAEDRAEAHKLHNDARRGGQKQYLPYELHLQEILRIVGRRVLDEVRGDGGNERPSSASRLGEHAELCDRRPSKISALALAVVCIVPATNRSLLHRPTSRI